MGHVQLTDSVDPLALRRQGVVEDVVSGRSDGEDMVILVDTELFDVHVGVFPCLKNQLSPGRIWSSKLTQP